MQKSIYFLGIGGVSMSALAKLCLHFKVKVYGSDDVNSEVLNELTKQGAKVQVGVNNEWIKKCDCLVYTIAVGLENEAIKFAKSNSKKVVERAEFLGEIASNFEHIIAISGTHGKTTTTAMLGNIFVVANKNPTIHIGGEALNIGGNLRLGGKEFFITEACEFNKSLLHIFPETTVITNIECDHMDTYADLNDIYKTFIQFGNQTKNNVIFCGDKINQKSFKISKNTITYGLKNCIYVAKNLKQKSGKFEFDCYIKNKKLGHIKLNVMGQHNVYNALACVAVAREYGMDFCDIVAGIEGYSGVKRRLTLLNKCKEVVYYHDYAHHPTEIEATLETLELLKTDGEIKRIIAIFQPHTYSRTRALINEFATCFARADMLYILPTYSAREQYQIGGDALDIFYKINGSVPCAYFSNITALAYELDKEIQEKDCVVWLGAGDIIEWAEQYDKYIKNKK